MLKISKAVLTEQKIVLRLEGQLIDRWVEVVDKTCEKLLAAGCALLLDLQELSFAGNEGIELLHQLNERNVSTINCSPFLKERLKEIHASTLNEPTHRSASQLFIH